MSLFSSIIVSFFIRHCPKNLYFKVHNTFKFFLNSLALELTRWRFVHVRKVEVDVLEFVPQEQGFSEAGVACGQTKKMNLRSSKMFSAF
jgi:hypothetical protein